MEMSNIAAKKVTRLDVQRRRNLDIKLGCQNDDFEQGT